jgi:hypothetical protein
LPGAGPSDAPVARSKNSNVISEPGASGAGPVVTVSSGLSWLKAMNSGTSPGRSASAVASIVSSGSPDSAEGAPASGLSASPPIAASISSWKISGRPVTHSISRNAVQIRLLHLWIRYQVRMVLRVTTAQLEGLAYRVNENSSQ